MGFHAGLHASDSGDQYGDSVICAVPSKDILLPVCSYPDLTPPAAIERAVG